MWQYSLRLHVILYARTRSSSSGRWIDDTGVRLPLNFALSVHALNAVLWRGLYLACKLRACIPVMHFHVPWCLYSWSGLVLSLVHSCSHGSSCARLCCLTSSHAELSALGSSHTLTVRQVSCIGLDLEILLLEFPYNLAPPSRYTSVGMRLSLTT